MMGYFPEWLRNDSSLDFPMEELSWPQGFRPTVRSPTFFYGRQTNVQFSSIDEDVL